MEIYKTEVLSHIPLCEPNLTGNEKQYVADAIDSNWLSGGAYLNSFEKKLAEFAGVSYAIGTSSGTTALHISLLLAGVERNDLVLVPNLTFVATANAVKYLGADPILVDIDPTTWVLDLDLMEEFLSQQTYLADDSCFCKKSNRRIKAVVPVHTLGNMCDMQRLLALAHEYNIEVIEDAACSLGSFQDGKHSGGFGLAGTLSFNSNKIITTGGGGAILTNNENLAKRAKHLITQAKSSSTEYYHDSLGYNYRLVNPLAAIGLAQLELLPDYLSTKRYIAEYYTESFESTGVEFQAITPNTDSNYWHFVIAIDRSRELITYLQSQNIECRPLWTPIHELPVFKNDLYLSNRDTTKYVSMRGVMLPCSTSIKEEQIERVCRAVKRFLIE